MARQSDLIAHLGDVPLFSHCSKRDLQALARNTEVLEFSEGARIVSQGDAGNAFYVLLDGSAGVARNGRHVGDLKSGDYFGELAILDPAPRNADIVAHTPVTVARLLVKPFRQMLRDVPAMNERLLAGLARRVRDADRRDNH
jgi:cAMP-dependent protein kinase regulator